MRNSFEEIRGIPETKRAELERQMARLFEGNRHLLAGHAAIAVAEYSGADMREKTEQMYSRARDYIPESIYLTRFFEKSRNAPR